MASIRTSEPVAATPAFGGRVVERLPSDLQSGERPVLLVIDAPRACS
jgi:hypothetical protein